MKLSIVHETTRRKWTDDEISSLTQLYPNHTYDELSNILGIPRNDIRNKLHQLFKNDKLKRKGPDKYTKEELNQIAELYSQNYTDKEIAGLLGKSSVEQAIKALRKFGKIDKKGPKIWIKELSSKLINLWNNSELTIEEIANQLNKPYITVNNQIRKLIRNGIISPKRNVGYWSEEEIKRLKYLWDLGATGPQIAYDLNKKDRNIIYGKVVGERFKNPLEWSRRKRIPRAVWPSNRVTELQQAVDNGLTYEEMAEYFNTTVVSILGAIRSYKVKLPKKRRVSESFERKLDVLIGLE